MRILIIVFVLIFNIQSLSEADDISDFEIEGMTVGESLLNYMKKTEIEDKINSNASYHYPNGSYVVFSYYSDEIKIKGFLIFIFFNILNNISKKILLGSPLTIKIGS